MNKKSNILLAGTALVLAAIGGCTKRIDNTNRADENLDLGNSATVQLYNVTVGSQRNFIYAEGERLNGASLTYTNAAFTPLFPASGPGFVVPAGLRSFLIRDTLATSTAQPALSFAENFQANTNYTIFTYDTVGAIKQKTVKTEIEIPADSTARLRFANFVYLKNGTPPPMDLYSVRRNDNLFTNVAYTEVTGFTPVASSFTTTSYTDTLYVRATGTTTPNLDTLVVSPLQKRSYTVVFRGRYVTNGSGGGTFPRTLSIFSND